MLLSLDHTACDVFLIGTPSKVGIRQASNHNERVLGAAKLSYINKIKESITFQKLGSQDFW